MTCVARPPTGCACGCVAQGQRPWRGRFSVPVPAYATHMHDQHHLAVHVLQLPVVGLQLARAGHHQRPHQAGVRMCLAVHGRPAGGGRTQQQGPSRLMDGRPWRWWPAGWWCCIPPAAAHCILPCLSMSQAHTQVPRLTLQLARPALLGAPQPPSGRSPDWVAGVRPLFAQPPPVQPHLAAGAAARRRRRLCRHAPLVRGKLPGLGRRGGIVQQAVRLNVDLEWQAVEQVDVQDISRLGVQQRACSRGGGVGRCCSAARTAGQLLARTPVPGHHHACLCAAPAYPAAPGAVPAQVSPPWC